MEELRGAGLVGGLGIAGLVDDALDGVAAQFGAGVVEQRVEQRRGRGGFGTGDEFVGETAGARGVARVLKERAQRRGGQRARGELLAAGDGLDGSAEPVHGEFVGVIHAGEDRRKLRSVLRGDGLPSGGGGDIPLTFRPDGANGGKGFGEGGRGGGAGGGE